MFYFLQTMANSLRIATRKVFNSRSLLLARHGVCWHGRPRIPPLLQLSPTSQHASRTMSNFFGIQIQNFSTTSVSLNESQAETVDHSLITDAEKAIGPEETKEFQAETRKLLDIVARSLYSEREVCSAQPVNFMSKLFTL